MDPDKGLPMKGYISSLLLVLVATLQLQTAQAQDEQPDVLDHPRDKRAQTGMQFLSVSMNPRAAALADAMVASDVGSSAAMFYNPAAMASLEGGDLSVGIIQWIADINYSGATIGFSPSGGRWGTFAITAVSVEYGDIEGTIRSSSDRGYERTGTFSPSALALGVGYARSLSDRFSVGGGIRYVQQDLGDSIMDVDMTSQENTASTPVFDFGVLYRTGFRSLNLGMSARNFSPTVTFEEEAFETPLVLAAGASIDILDVVSPGLTANHGLVISAEAGHPRSYDEQVRIGGEYQFMNILFLRAGYVTPNDEQGITLGAGLNLDVSGVSFGADYAYTQFGDLGNVNRMGVHLGF